jgi:hypothetical protein
MGLREDAYLVPYDSTACCEHRDSQILNRALKSISLIERRWRERIRE